LAVQVKAQLDPERIDAMIAGLAAPSR